MNPARRITVFHVAPNGSPAPGGQSRGEAGIEAEFSGEIRADQFQKEKVWPEFARKNESSPG